MLGLVVFKVARNVIDMREREREMIMLLMGDVFVYVILISALSVDAKAWPLAAL